MASRNPNLVSLKGKEKIGEPSKTGKEVRRPALTNISNVVPVDKQPVNRPVTRAYAKLLADAQAAATVPANTKNIKKDEKLKQKEIVPSPLVRRSISQIDPQRVNRPKSSRIRRSVHTLSYLLNFRSKDACGSSRSVNSESDLLNLARGDQINLPERGDQFDVVEYVEDLYIYYKQVEETYWPCEYMTPKKGITPRMREILMDWIVDMHQSFELRPETLYLSVYIVDRYLSLELNPVRRVEIQLIGLCSILLASKYEEVWSPRVNDLIDVCRNAYSLRDALDMEKRIINKLGWYLTIPTPYMFLVRFIKTSNDDKELENMIYFFAELALMNYSLIRYVPSLLAASCVYAARGTLRRTPIWNRQLAYYTDYSEPQLWQCARILLVSHLDASEGKYGTVYKKYSDRKLGKVALRRPVSIAECLSSKSDLPKTPSTSSAGF